MLSSAFSRFACTPVLWLLCTALVLLWSCDQNDEPATPVDPPVDNTGVSNQDLLDEINSIRTNPAGYAVYIEAMRPYFNGNRYEVPGEIPVLTSEGVAAVNEAIAYLKNTSPVPPLQWSEGLAKAAADHRSDTGPKGIVGHTGSDGSTVADRASRHGTWDIRIGENISYGQKTARSIMIQFLVDDGVANRGHRLNLMQPDYRYVGMAFGFHAQYEVMCVQALAGSYTEKGAVNHSPVLW